MSQRIERVMRAKIRKDKRPVRVIAKEDGISPRSVQLWKKRDSVFDQSRDPTVCPEMDNFEEIIFLEMLRLSRYHHGKLMRYLAPISTRLPSQETPLIGRSKAHHKLVSKQTARKPITSSTVLRRMQRYASGKLISARDEKDAKPGTVAIHKIRITWSTAEGEQHKSEIILLMERATGLLYARAYNIVGLGEAKNCMSRIEQMYGYDILSMNFVMSRRDWFDPNDASYSSVLNSPRSKRDRSLLVNRTKLDLVDEIAFDFPLCADDDTPYQTRRALIPGTFKCLDALNRSLSRLVNKINLTPRHYFHKGSRRELAPINNLMKYTSKRYTELGKFPLLSHLPKQITLPRKWKYPIIYVPIST